MHALPFRRSVSTLFLLLGTALLTTLLVLQPTGAASAHDELVSSDPATGSSIESLPEQLTLTFSAGLIDAPDGTAVVVTDPEGRSIAEGAPQLNGAILTQPLSADAAVSGEYQVVWQVVSSDGHPTDGEFSFTVTTGAQSEPTATATAEPTEAASEEPSAAEPSETPASEDENMASGFSLSMPWLIGGAVVLIIAVFLLVVFLVRRGRGSSSTASDSDDPAER